jgi:hypothetical protein
MQTKFFNLALHKTNIKVCLFALLFLSLGCSRYYPVIQPLRGMKNCQYVFFRDNAKYWYDVYYERFDGDLNKTIDSTNHKMYLYMITMTPERFEDLCQYEE